MSPEEAIGTADDNPAFSCSSCGCECCAESAGKKDEQGRPLCIPCSLKIVATTASSVTREKTEVQQANVAAVEELREKRKGSRRLTAALLLLAIPVICVELFLLLNARPAALSPADVAEIELTESAIMVTVLGQYSDEYGRYPPSLEALVPEFWPPEEVVELQKFQYTPIGVDDFRLIRNGSALPAPLVSQAMGQDLLPASMTARTDFDAYYDRIDEAH